MTNGPDGFPRKTLVDYARAQRFLEQCAEYGFPLPSLMVGDEEAHYQAERLLEFVRSIAQGHNPISDERWPTAPYRARFDSKFAK
jgi:hypothetical protein